jgi:hypothetical protein
MEKFKTVVLYESLAVVYLTLCSVWSEKTVNCDINPTTYIGVYIILEIMCIIQNVATMYLLKRRRTELVKHTQIFSYILDGIMTAYYAFGLYLLLFKPHSCNDQASLNYINMVVLLIIVSPKVAVYLVISVSVLMFCPCLMLLLIQYFRDPDSFIHYGNVTSPTRTDAQQPLMQGASDDTIDKLESFEYDE